MKGGLKNIVLYCQQYFFDLVFPKHCLNCDQEGTYLCVDCQALSRLSWGN